MLRSCIRKNACSKYTTSIYTTPSAGLSLTGLLVSIARFRFTTALKRYKQSGNTKVKFFLFLWVPHRYNPLQRLLLVKAVKRLFARRLLAPFLYKIKETMQLKG
jgi:hypothetical protein